MNTADAGVSGSEPVATSGTADRARRLFEFLAEVQRLKAPPKLTTDRYEDVFWLCDMPAHAAVQVSTDLPDADPQAPVLLVEKLARPADPPTLPTPLKVWVDGPVNDPAARPSLRQEPTSTDMPNGTCGDALHVDEIFDRWIREWSAWSERIRADKPVRDLYRRLFSASEFAGTQIEEYELVIGIGQLDWTPHGHSHVSRHLLTYPAVIGRDESTGTITIAPEPTAEPLEVELDMLDPSLTRSSVFTEVRAEARQYDRHPLDRVTTGAFVRRLVNALDPEAQYTDDGDRLPTRETPRAAFAPALILRRRTSRGLIQIFEGIASEISGTDQVPAGLLPLVEPDYVPPTPPSVTNGAIVHFKDDDVLLPLPLNDRQLEVINRADVDAQTLVQGPPGTGKTHTAAALVTHLLAQGKRVLVTAHTDRALKEVRGKLPEAIKPLAVSIVGSDRHEMANLKTAVNELSSRSSEDTPAESERQIETIVEKLDKLRRERAQLRRKVVAVRAGEVDLHEFAGAAGTLAEIAKRYQSNTEAYRWILDYIAPEPDAEPPMTDADAIRWLALVRDDRLTADEDEAAARLPKPDSLPRPEDFSVLVDEEAAGAMDASAHVGLRDHAAYEAVASLSSESRQNLRERMERIAVKAAELEQHGESWIDAALHDIRTGRASRWQEMSARVSGLISQTSPFVQRLGVATHVTIAPNQDVGVLVNLARSVHRYLGSGGAIRTSADGAPKVGAFTSRTVKSAQPLFAAVRVDGLIPTTIATITAFLEYAEGSRLLDALDRAWPADVEIPVEDTLHERLQWHATELEQLHRLLFLGARLDEEEAHLRAVGIPHPDWSDIEAVLAYAKLVDAATAHERHLQASRPLADLETYLHSVTEWDDAGQISSHLEQACRERDRSAYAQSYDRLTRLHSVRGLVSERDALSARLRAVAPQLVDVVVGNADTDLWGDRIARLGCAWDWARTGAWLRDQDNDDVNALHRQLDTNEQTLHHHVEQLAAARAWRYAIAPQRLTGRSRADLSQYAQLVKRLGKGTGKYAPRLRSQVRKAMDRCRPAVPVWIMPIYRITEQLQVQQNMFDVVIVDEASQAGLEAAFLQYLAPRIVVIGDDRQVSPTAVGTNREQLHDLANQYLYDNPYKATWEAPDVSLFDLAAQRFRRITLREHRRCVPEIVGFSNRIAYEPDNVPLIPVRQYGADRLDPVELVYVPDGYEQGSSGAKTNPAEVDAIVDQVQKCLADPDYDDLSFGIVSLVGNRQAQQIQAALLDVVSAEEWDARDLRCGDAADFQGSERDVMFLSMVSAPEEGRRFGSLVREQYVQRFNVAVSRAKDQVWLFHSLTLEDVPNSEDVRHQLISYFQEVKSKRSGDLPTCSLVSDDLHVEPFDSLFEQRVYNRIVDRGYLVEPQYDANGYRIDLVVTGAQARLAIECDGDVWPGPDQFGRDIARQRDLERCGWRFFRIRESAWYTDQYAVLEELRTLLDELDIYPVGQRIEPSAVSEVAPASVPTIAPAIEDLSPGHDRAAAAESVGDTPDHVDAEAGRWQGPFGKEVAPSHRRPRPTSVALLPALPDYESFAGSAPSATEASGDDVIDVLVEIVDTEGPLTGGRLYHAYLEASPDGRLGKEIERSLNRALSSALRRGLIQQDDSLSSSGYKKRTFFVAGQPSALLRQLGPRHLNEVPPRELAELVRVTSETIEWEQLDDLYRVVLSRLGRNRLTAQARKALNAVLSLADA